MQRFSSKYVVITSDYLIPGLIIVMVLTLFWLAFYSRLFSVSDIICQTDYDPCENSALEAELAKFKGVNIFRLDADLIKKRVLSGEYMVREVDIKRTLPNRVIVSLQSVLPTLAVKAESDPRYLTLDSKFRVIKISSTKPNVISLTVPTLPPVQVGKSLGEDYLPLFKLISEINQKLPGILGVSLTPDGAVAVKLDQITAIMSTSGALERQVSLLQAVVSDSTIIAGKSEVDVRFAQPVLR